MQIDREESYNIPAQFPVPAHAKQHVITPTPSFDEITPEVAIEGEVKMAPSISSKVTEFIPNKKKIYRNYIKIIIIQIKPFLEVISWNIDFGREKHIDRTRPKSTSFVCIPVCTCS